MNIKDLVEERGKQYGTFYDNAAVIQELKEVVLANSKDWYKLQPDVKQALEMICTKMGRIITGNPDNVDSWEDIAGYSVLVADRIKKDKEWVKTNVPPAKAGAQGVR